MASGMPKLCQSHWPLCAYLTHLPQVHASMTWFNTGSDNGLSPVWHQAIISTNLDLLLIGPLGANFSEILIKIRISSFMTMHLKMLSVKWQPFGPGGEELIDTDNQSHPRSWTRLTYIPIMLKSHADNSSHHMVTKQSWCFTQYNNSLNS